MDEAKFNNLCSHYKDTFDIHRDTIKQRDILFYILLLILSVFTLQLSSTEVVTKIVADYVGKSTGIKLGKDAEFISTLLWFGLLGVSTRYFQLVVDLERQYTYLHSLEAEINAFFSNSVAFTREGKSYLSNYPTFSNWVWALYTIFFPLIILGCIYARMSNEFAHISNIGVNILLDFSCYIIIGTSTTLYLFRLHWSSMKDLIMSGKTLLRSIHHVLMQLRFP
jgi:hypothetical protein